MDLPTPPSRPPNSRAPGSGLKLMLAILFVFALLAVYGQWEHLRSARIETAIVQPAPGLSPSPSPND